MSQDNKAIKILELYAVWYHKEMLNLSLGDRKNKPNINEFLSVQIGREQIADLLLSTPELKALAKALEL